MFLTKSLSRPSVICFNTSRKLTSRPTVLSQGKSSEVRFGTVLSIRSSMSSSALSEEQVQQVDRILDGVNDDHDGVIVEMTKEPLDPDVFASLLKASLTHWRQLVNLSFPHLGYQHKNKRGIWIKIPIELVNLVESAVKEGFYFHHAEPRHLMLVHWLPSTPNTLPANATHRVRIGAFVLNDKDELLVVQEKSGKFRGTGIWKFPTGVVDEGEDICDAAVREVKEETGVDAKFVEILAFRQSHKAFFEKSDLFFLCTLQPISSDIVVQESEIEDAQWMPYQDYIAQPFVQKNEYVRYLADICTAKKDKGYVGFTPVATRTSFSNTSSYLYLNKQSLNSSKT